MNSAIDFNVGYNRLSSGSIAATVSSGYTGINTEDTDPELTYLSAMYSGHYDNLEGKSYGQNIQSSSSMWPAVTANDNQHHFQLPSFMTPPAFQPRDSKSQTVNSSMPLSSFGTGITISGGLRQEPVSNNRHSMESSASGSIISPKPISGYAMVDSNLMPAVSKKQFSLNVHAPSYNPTTSTLTNIEKRNMGVMKDLASISPKQMTPGTRSEVSETETIESLRMEILYKNQANALLNEKINTLKLDQKTNVLDEKHENLVKMPNNYYQLFRDLTRTLNERTQELEDTKSRLEAIVVAMVMGKNSTITSNGSFDGQELAHRITNKMEVLQAENEALLKMISHSNKQSLLIEIGLLKNENNLLRQKLEKADSKP